MLRPKRKWRRYDVVTGNMITAMRKYLLLPIAVILYCLGFDLEAVSIYGVGMLFDVIDGKTARRQQAWYNTPPLPAEATFWQALRHRGSSNWGATQDQQVDKLSYLLPLWIMYLREQITPWHDYINGLALEYGRFAPATVSPWLPVIATGCVASLVWVRWYKARHPERYPPKTANKSWAAGQVKAWIEASVVVYWSCPGYWVVVTIPVFGFTVEPGLFWGGSLALGVAFFALACTFSGLSLWGHLRGGMRQVNQIA